MKRSIKRISIQHLKARLSAAIAEAESGETLLITRHNRPVAQLGRVIASSVHRGTDVGTDRLRPALKRGTKGRYLTLLLEDRSNR